MTTLTLSPVSAGSLPLVASSVDTRAMLVETLSWSSSRAFSFAHSTIDGVLYIDRFTDASGTASPVTYTKLFGGSATKTGHGNLDAHWASLTHQGDGEVGLFIGDATAPVGSSGGNLWGGHFDLTANVAAKMIGLRIDLNPNVDVSGKETYGVVIHNSNDLYPCNYGLRIYGQFSSPIRVWSDAQGNTEIYSLDIDGTTHHGGAVLPLVDATYDLGSSSGGHWRTVYCTGVSVNGGDGAGGGGNLNLHNTALAPPNTPSSGGVIYVDAGALKYKGSSGTVTTIANA